MHLKTQKEEKENARSQLKQDLSPVKPGTTIIQYGAQVQGREDKDGWGGTEDNRQFWVQARTDARC